MKVYDRKCEKLDKDVTNVGELGNEEYLLKSFIWFIGKDDNVYVLKNDKSNEKYDFLCEYTDESFESIKSLVSDKIGEVNDENFVFFSREISELDNTIYDVWLYEIKPERVSPQFCVNSKIWGDTH